MTKIINEHLKYLGPGFYGLGHYLVGDNIYTLGLFLLENYRQEIPNLKMVEMVKAETSVDSVSGAQQVMIVDIRSEGAKAVVRYVDSFGKPPIIDSLFVPLIEGTNIFLVFNKEGLNAAAAFAAKCFDVQLIINREVHYPSVFNFSVKRPESHDDEDIYSHAVVEIVWWKSLVDWLDTLKHANRVLYKSIPEGLIAMEGIRNGSRI